MSEQHPVVSQLYRVLDSHVTMTVAEHPAEAVRAVSTVIIMDIFRQFVLEVSRTVEIPGDVEATTMVKIGFDGLAEAIDVIKKEI